MRFRIVLWALIASSILPALVLGEVSSLDHATETQALVQRLVLDRAAAVVSVQRVADEREEQLFADLAAKDRRLRAEQRTRKEAQAELAKVTAERQHLVDELASKSRQFAAEIEEYRRQVASIANSPDPRKREALRRYAEGDRVEAFNDLVAVQEELDKANDKASAAGWRELGELALDLKDRGDKDTNTVIDVFEKAQKKDPDGTWGWIVLRRLYQEAGRLSDAHHAAEQAVAHAQGARDRSVAESELGDVLVVEGNLAGASERFNQCFKLIEQLAKEGSADPTIQRDLGISLNRLGDVLLKMGDVAGAHARFEQALTVLGELAKARPPSETAQRDLSVVLERLGDVLVKENDLIGARKQYERCLRIREQLAKAHPDSVDAQRNLSINHNRLGTLLEEKGDLVGARKQFEKVLQINEKLANANPTSATAQRDFAISLGRLGVVLAKAHDLVGARQRQEKALQIAEQLAKVQPNSADAQLFLSASMESLGGVLLLMRDRAGARQRFEQALQKLETSNPASAESQYLLIAAHARLGELTGNKAHWSEALRLALALQSQGLLPPRYVSLLDYLQKQLADTEKAKP